MTPEALSYLKTRLEQVRCVECADAAKLVADAIATAYQELPVKVERDLCHSVWGCISRALDVAELSNQDELVLDALEAEMAGRVLTARLALGELVKATEGDVVFDRDRKTGIWHRISKEQRKEHGRTETL